MFDKDYVSTGGQETTEVCMHCGVYFQYVFISQLILQAFDKITWMCGVTATDRFTCKKLREIRR